jgi:cation diffusion facilitator family transporter
VADFVVLLANRHSRKDADEDHPYGHQRFETAASLALGVLLLAVGVGMLWSRWQARGARDGAGGARRGAVGGRGRAGGQGAAVSLHAVGGQAVKSSMLVANAWHARSDAASSLVVGVGIVGNLAGYPILDPIAALIVGFMVAKMGWSSAGTRCTT